MGNKMGAKLWHHYRSKEAFKEGVTAIIQEGDVQKIRNLMNPSEFLEENWDIAMGLAFDAAADSNRAELILAVLGEAGGNSAQHQLIAQHHYAAFCQAVIKDHKEAMMVLLAHMDDTMIKKALHALKDRHDIGKTVKLIETLERDLNTPASALRADILSYKKTYSIDA